MELIVSILRPVLLVILVIDMIALIIIVLLQSDKSGGLGVLGGGSSQTGFGSRKADPIVRVTQILGTVFLIGSFALAFLTSYSSARIDDELDTTTPDVTPETENLENDNIDSTTDEIEDNIEENEIDENQTDETSELETNENTTEDNTEDQPDNETNNPSPENN